MYFFIVLSFVSGAVFSFMLKSYWVYFQIKNFFGSFFDEEHFIIKRKFIFKSRLKLILQKSKEKLNFKFENISNLLSKIEFHLSQLEITQELLLDFFRNICKLTTKQNEFSKEVELDTNNLKKSFEIIQESSIKQESNLQSISVKLNEFNQYMKNLNIDTSKFILNSKTFSIKVLKTEPILNSANLNMNNIANSSSKIKEIVDNINEISEQTNLLAINTSIEAARAGKLGLGFSILAKEITKLSDKTLNSAKEIENFAKITSKEVQTGIHTLALITEIFQEMVSWSKEFEKFLTSNQSSIQTNSEKLDIIYNNIEFIKKESSLIKQNAIIQTQAVNRINANTEKISNNSEDVLMNSIEAGALVEELKRITLSLKNENNFK